MIVLDVLEPIAYNWKKACSIISGYDAFKEQKMSVEHMKTLKLAQSGAKFLSAKS